MKDKIKRAMTLALALVAGAAWADAAIAAQAGSVSEAEAGTVAAYFTSKDAVGSRALAGRTVDAVTERGALWLVALKPSGHLFVSANRSAEPIPSFSEQDFVEPAADSPQAVLLALAEENARTATGSKHEARWRALLGLPTVRLAAAGVKTASAETSTYVAPLLSSAWSQGAPYNDFAPVNTGVHDPNGCVATAFGQIMRYWEWPERVDEDFFSEHIADATWGFKQQLWAGTALDWSAMPLSGYATEADRLNVGRGVMLCGMLAKMAYAAKGSSSLNRDVSRNPWYTLPKGVDCNGENADAIKSAVLESLSAKCPILVSIGNPDHAIVCDGCSESGGTFYVHLNYGWGGTSTQNYTLDYVIGSALLSSLFYGQRPRPMVQADAMGVASTLPLTLNWAFPKKGYEETLSGFTVKYAEVGAATSDWTDDFSGQQGAVNGESVAVGTIACDNATPVLHFASDANWAHYTWPAKFVGADSVLSFRVRSHLSRGMAIYVQAYNPSTGWETVCTPELADVDTIDWQTVSVPLSRYANKAVGLRIEARRISLQGVSGDNAGVQFDDFRITGVRAIAEPAEAIEVAGNVRSHVFTAEKLAIGKDYVFTVEPKVTDGVVSPAVSTKIVAEAPAAASIDAITSVRTTGFQVEEGFCREGHLGLNQFGVYGSGATTGLVVRLSHPVLIDKSTLDFDVVDQKYIVTAGATSVVHAVAVEKVRNGKFLVKLDFGMLTEYVKTTRMMVTFDALDAKGNVARKDFNLLLNSTGGETAIAKEELPDYGGGETEPDPEDPNPEDPEGPEDSEDPEGPDVPDVPSNPDEPVADDATIGVASNAGDPGTDYSKTYGYEMYDNYWTARKRAIQQGKQLFVLSGASWCSNCAFVKSYLKTLGTKFTDAFVVYYADHDSTACQCFQGGLPQYGAADPRQIDAFTGTLNGSTRSWDVAWQTDTSGIYAQDRGGYASARVDNVVNAGKPKAQYDYPTNLVIRGLATLGTGTVGHYELYAQFKDGVEMPVDYGVDWSVSGANGTLADAAIDGRDMAALTLTSGSVTLTAKSTFYFTGTRTLTVECAPESDVASVEIVTDEVNLEDDATPTIEARATLKNGKKIPVFGFGAWTATFKRQLPRSECPELEENSYQALHPSITVDSASRLIYATGASGLLEVCDQKIDVTLTVNGQTATREITVWGPTKVIASKWTMLSGDRQTTLGVVRLNCTELKYNYGGKIKTTTDTYFASYATVLKSGIASQTSYLRGLTVFVDNASVDKTYTVDLKAQKVNGKYKSYTPELGTESGRAVSYTSLARGAYRTEIAEGLVPDGFFKAFFPARSDYAKLAEEDADGDGFKNWEEYVLGTDPTNASDAFTLMQGYQHLAAPAANGETMQYKVMYAQRAGRVYYVDAKKDWNDAWSHVATVNLADMKASAVTTFTDLDADLADQGKFFRVRAALNDHLFGYGDAAPVISPNMLVAAPGSVIDLSTSTSPLDLTSFDTDATDAGTVYVKVPSSAQAGDVLITAPAAAAKSMTALAPQGLAEGLAFAVKTLESGRLALTVVSAGDAQPTIEGGDEKGFVTVEDDRIVVAPKEGVREITIVNPGARNVEIPPSVDRIVGVSDPKKIVVRQAFGAGQTVDLTAILAFSPVEGGYALALDASAAEKTVSVDGEDVPVRPTLSGADDAVKPMLLDDGSVTLGVKTIPGLTYQLRTSATPDGGWTDVGSPQTADGARLSLTAERNGNSSAFYSIVVTK